eukprot:GDKI01002209.1.p1 GENE.GDKI01002209.1~~GDKI01002209.1.p1  ORF type:complete len:113 (-),score=13.92 GDKI01002209.1:66-404(-)
MCVCVHGAYVCIERDVLLTSHMQRAGLLGPARCMWEWCACSYSSACHACAHRRAHACFNTYTRLAYVCVECVTCVCVEYRGDVEPCVTAREHSFTLLFGVAAFARGECVELM